MGGLVGAMLCLAGQPCFQVTIAPTPSSFPSPSWVAGKMLLEYPGNANLARYLRVSRNHNSNQNSKQRNFRRQQAPDDISHTPNSRQRFCVFASIFQQTRSSLGWPAPPFPGIACFTRPLLPGGKPPHFDSTLSTQDFDNFEDCWGTKQEEFCKDEVSSLSAPLIALKASKKFELDH